MAALDMNKDGVDDLVVSAPAFGEGGVSSIEDFYPKNYNGRVYIFLGEQGVGIR